MSSVVFSRKGVGTTLVLIHGFLESSVIWDHLQLDQSFDCIFVDLPGHGKNNYAKDCSIAEIAEDIRILINELQIESYKIIGHSLGGYVALELIERDMRCSDITLLNSNFWTDDETKKIDRRRVAKLVENKKEFFISEAIPSLFAKPEKFKDEIALLIHNASEIPWQSIASLSIAMSERKDFSDWIEQNQGKVTIIQGKKDKTVLLNTMNTKTGNLNSINIHLLNDGHMSWCENPENLIKILVKEKREP